jgi:hypothetical protein
MSAEKVTESLPYVAVGRRVFNKFTGQYFDEPNNECASHLADSMNAGCYMYQYQDWHGNDEIRQEIRTQTDRIAFQMHEMTAAIVNAIEKLGDKIGQSKRD